GGKIRDRMERVWRAAAAAPLSKLEIAVSAAGAALLLYAVLYSHLPQGLHLPRNGERFLTNHVSGSVKAIAIATLIALFTPASLVYHLRSGKAYRVAVRGLKLFLLPLFFAACFLVMGLLFASHLAFS